MSAALTWCLLFQVHQMLWDAEISPDWVLSGRPCSMLCWLIHKPPRGIILSGLRTFVHWEPMSGVVNQRLNECLTSAKIMVERIHCFLVWFYTVFSRYHTFFVCFNTVLNTYLVIQCIMSVSPPDIAPQFTSSGVLTLLETGCFCSWTRFGAISGISHYGDNLPLPDSLNPSDA